jgi:3-hexulose-6-phosphate synthase
MVNNHTMTSIGGVKRSSFTHGIVQVSLDLTSIDDALRMAAIAVEAGADWLEIGTPLALAEGTRAVTALRREYPDHPLIADLKVMDGGYGEASLYIDAGADAIVVMGRAYDATIEAVCEAASASGTLVMGDDMGADDYGAEAARLERLGVGMVLHHIGHDHRNAHRELGLSPLTDLPAVVAGCTVPVQAVGGLSIEEAILCPTLGAPVVVFGAPLTIDDERGFVIPEGDLLSVLKPAVDRVHSTEVSSPARL